MKSRLILGLGLTLGSSLFTAALAQTQASWTVLVYLHADHNLSPSAERDVEEMKKANLAPSSGVNVVLQWDRGGRGVGQDKGITREIVSGNATRVLAQGSDDDAQWDMDDPAVLERFLDWGMKTYPAERYAVVMWNHGGQWTGGFGGDENRPGGLEKASIGPTQVRNALSSALRKNGVAQLDVLAYDTCLMGGLELLLEYDDLAKLYLANPEIDYGDGLEYEKTLQWLARNPRASVSEFAAAEAPIWAAHHNTEEADQKFRAHSAYLGDPARIATLRQATAAFARALASSPSRYQARQAAVEYSFSGDATDASAIRDFTDLGDLATQAAKLDPSLSGVASALNSAISGVVIQKVLGKNNTRASGLSVWLPNDRRSGTLEDALLTSFAALRLGQDASGVAEWRTLLPGWFAGVRGNTEAPSVTPPAASPTPPSGSTATFAFAVDDGAAQDLSSVYALLGNADGDTLEIYGHLLLEDATPDQAGFEASWDGTWWQASSMDQKVFISGLQLDSEDPTLYVPVRYTYLDESESNSGTLLLDPEDGTIEALLDDEGLTPNEVDLGGVQSLEFVRLIRDAQGNLSEQDTGQVLEVSDLKLERVLFDAPAPVILGGASDWAGNDTGAVVALN